MKMTPPPKPWEALSWYDHADAMLCSPDNAPGIAARVALLDEQGHGEYADWLREHHGEWFNPETIRAHDRFVSKLANWVSE